jgi:hypothetical protein
MGSRRFAPIRVILFWNKTTIFMLGLNSNKFPETLSRLLPYSQNPCKFLYSFNSSPINLEIPQFEKLIAMKLGKIS